MVNISQDNLSQIVLPNYLSYCCCLPHPLGPKARPLVSTELWQEQDDGSQGMMLMNKGMKPIAEHGSKPENVISSSK